MHIKHSLHIRTVLRRGFRFCLRLSSRRRCPRNLSLPPVRPASPSRGISLTVPPPSTLADLNHLKPKSKRYTPNSQFNNKRDRPTAVPSFTNTICNLQSVQTQPSKKRLPLILRRCQPVQTIPVRSWHLLIRRTECG